MWNTSQGDRVLKGAEAALFRSGLDTLLFWMDQSSDDPWQTGVGVFDVLSTPERLAILEHVSRALLDPDVPSPPLTAVSEGAVAAVYLTLFSDVELEIFERRCDARRRVLAACVENDYEEPPDLNCDDADEWRDVIESVMDWVLWDRDWDEAFIRPDDPPEVAQEVREFANIDPDYYAAVPVDPNPVQLQRIEASLQDLRREPAGGA